MRIKSFYLTRKNINTLAVAIVLSTGVASAQQTHVKVQDGISEPVKAWIHAVEAGDVKAIARMNGPSTIAYIPNAMVVTGSEAIAASYAGMFEKYTAKIEVKDAHYVQSGYLINSWGLYVLNITPKDGGKPVRIEGRFSDLSVKNNGQWQYILDHASLPVK